MTSSTSFYEFKLDHEFGEIAVTIIRPGGKTPATLITELKGEIEKLKNRNPNESLDGKCRIAVRHIPATEQHGRIHTDRCKLTGYHVIHSVL